MDNVLHLISQACHKWPERPCLWVDDNEYSYEFMWNLAARMSVLIRQHVTTGCGLHSESYIALFGYRSLTAYVGVVASIQSGMTYLPLNPRFPKERNVKMAVSTAASCWIVDNRCLKQSLEILSEIETSVIVLLPEINSLEVIPPACSHHSFFFKDDIEAINSNQFQMPVIHRDTALYTLFTSGSTGEPKGITVSHANFLAYLKGIRQYVAAVETDRFAQLFDMTFDVSVHNMICCWEAGACLYNIPESANLLTGRFVSENQLTHWFSVPSTASLLKKLGLLHPNSLMSLKNAMFIGEPLSRKLVQSFQLAAPNAQIYNTYGPTETTVAMTIYQWTQADQVQEDEGIVPIGNPLLGTHIAVVNDNLEAVPPGMPGELLIAGPQVTEGYYKNTILTADAFIHLHQLGASEDVYYKSGDLVVLKEGVLHFLGRKDRQVKIRGFRVELQEVEIALRGIVNTDQVAVIGIPPNATEGFMGILAFIVDLDSDQSEAASTSILNECRQKLPDYMVPSRITWLPELPYNTNGKINYKDLIELERNSEKQLL